MSREEAQRLDDTRGEWVRELQATPDARVRDLVAALMADVEQEHRGLHQRVDDLERANARLHRRIEHGDEGGMLRSEIEKLKLRADYLRRLHENEQRITEDLRAVVSRVKDERDAIRRRLYAELDRDVTP